MMVSPSSTDILVKVDTRVNIFVMRVEVVEDLGGSVNAFGLEA
jgi:hypothetical protein